MLLADLAPDGREVAPNALRIEIIGGEIPTTPPSSPMPITNVPPAVLAKATRVLRMGGKEDRSRATVVLAGDRLRGMAFVNGIRRRDKV
jgi:hypothetical protein